MIWELRHEHKVGLLIDIAGIPRSTYYYYSKQFEDPKPDKYAAIKEKIRQIYIMSVSLSMILDTIVIEEFDRRKPV